MPGAPRPKGKAKDIAYSILGIPANMPQKKRKRRPVPEPIDLGGIMGEEQIPSVIPGGAEGIMSEEEYG